jgi:integrase
VLTRAEVGALFAEIAPEWSLFFRLLLHTGVRISEALGLLWGDVRFGERPQVEIRRQVCGGLVKPPKSRYGRRRIPLSPDMAAKLATWRQASQFSTDADPIFTSERGGFLDASNVRKRVLLPTTRKAGLERVGFHSFRHTCASLLFAAGKDLKQVQQWLGHHDPAFTLSTYVHLLDDGLGDAAFLDGCLPLGSSANAQERRGVDRASAVESTAISSADGALHPA